MSLLNLCLGTIFLHRHCQGLYSGAILLIVFLCRQTGLYREVLLAFEIHMQAIGGGGRNTHVIYQTLLWLPNEFYTNYFYLDCLVQGLLVQSYTNHYVTGSKKINTCRFFNGVQSSQQFVERSQRGQRYSLVHVKKSSFSRTTHGTHSRTMTKLTWDPSNSMYVIYLKKNRSFRISCLLL